MTVPINIARINSMPTGGRVLELRADTKTIRKTMANTGINRVNSIYVATVSSDEWFLE